MLINLRHFCVKKSHLISSKSCQVNKKEQQILLNWLKIKNRKIQFFMNYFKNIKYKLLKHL